MDFIFIAFLGAIIGSFLNVVIYRLHTGKSLNGRSHCLSCGIGLSWYELVPVLSYVVLKGRCHHCSSFISPRYLFVEILTGMLFVLSFATASSDFLLLLTLFVMVSVLVIILVYDVLHTIIPDSLVVLLTLSAGIIVVVTKIPVETAVLSAFSTSVFFAFFWLISNGRWMGLGDAKLAFPLALIFSPVEAFSMVVLSFWIGAVVSIILIGIQNMLRKGKTRLFFLSSQLTIKSEIPFAPFLIFGFIGVYFFHVDILAITDAFTKFFLG